MSIRRSRLRAGLDMFAIGDRLVVWVRGGSRAYAAEVIEGGTPTRPVITLLNNDRFPCQLTMGDHPGGYQILERAQQRSLEQQPLWDRQLALFEEVRRG